MVFTCTVPGGRGIPGMTFWLVPRASVDLQSGTTVGPRIAPRSGDRDASQQSCRVACLAFGGLHGVVW